MTPVDAASARSVEALAAAMQAGARPKFVFFWGHRAARDGQLSAACFSQWWPARFTADGQAFGSAEHYMMWRKARLFGDEQRAGEILNARSPAQAKAIGREVSGFDEETWIRRRWEVVVAGSVAKFGSDPALRDYLLGTGRRILVEASPVDRIWGIGLAADSGDAEKPQQWRGLNLLGFALMEARQRLQH
jgi:ribA/ribD-fused uncharacterized protein